MKSLSPKEAIAILSDMKIDILIPKAAVTQRKRNAALDMAISALNCSEIPNSLDYISRQDAIDTHCAICPDKDKCPDRDFVCPDRELFRMIKPVDAVPVIRCMDCRFATWYDAADGVKRCFCGIHGSAGHTEKDFCSYAEREEMN